MKKKWMFVLVAAMVGCWAGRAFAGKTDKSRNSSSAEIAKPPSIKVSYSWNNPEAEKVWQERCSNSTRHSSAPRMGGVDAGQAEGMLEAFGLRYMPNAYAHYQEVRAAALEAEQTLADNFPNGKDSDPSGGGLYDKVAKRVVAAVAEMNRRRDELCFFLLFHQAGIFSDEVLAKYDGKPISVWLADESASWPDDTPNAVGPLAVPDATFAEKYMPETHAGWQRLSNLFNDGAKQYRGLRGTALALGAPRARRDLAVARTRLQEINGKLAGLKTAFPVWRVQHAVGELSAADLEQLDHETAARIQIAEREWNFKTYMANRYKKGTIMLPGEVPMELVWCPPGSFTMGSPKDEKGRVDGETQHEVVLTKGFWMAKTEVTQRQWKSVMGNNPSKYKHDGKGDDFPVENVTWKDCQTFCQKTGLSLPTEAEWEYACRAGSTGAYAGTGTIKEMGWTAGGFGGMLVRGLFTDGDPYRVGKKMPNGWGLYDMHGNVHEWCEDWYGSYPRGPVTNPTGAASGTSRVIRGGSVWSHEDCCRSAYRAEKDPNDSNGATGFRPVLRQE